MRAIILVVLFFSISSSVFAADTYYAQSAAGSNTGADCADAYALGSISWAAGNTYHLCGTFTGSAGSTMITVGASGSAGNPITVKFESGAVLTAPYWSTTTGAINVNGKSYVTIDGGTNGVIQNTANGTSLANQQDSIGVYIPSSNHVTVQNLTIQNIYVRVANTSGSAGSNSAGVLALDCDNLLVSHNTITHAREGIGHAFTANHSNFEVANNVISNVEVGLAFATTSASAVYTTFLLHDNEFTGGANLWDEPSNAFHHNCLHMWAQATGAAINGTLVYNNYIHGIYGNDSTYYGSSGGTHITSMYYFEEIAGVANLFNNVIDLSAGTQTLNSTANGMVFCKESAGQRCNLYNNTFVKASGDVGFETESGSGVTGHILKNNIFYNVGYAMYVPNGDSSVIADYNLYYGVSDWGAAFDSFAQWQSAGQDAHGKNGLNPNLVSYVPQVGSPVISSGVNLTSLGITALNSDKNGTDRPSSGAWDIGAYEYTTGSPVDGACGSDNGQTFTTLSPGPVNLCSTGTAGSLLTGQSPNYWTWPCNGSGGGSNASCSANYSPPAGGTISCKGCISIRR